MRPERESTLEYWFKLADHLDDHGRDLVDKCDGTVLPVNSYTSGHVSCHVHLSFASKVRRESASTDYCAKFSRLRFRKGAEVTAKCSLHESEDLDHSGCVLEGVGRDYHVYRHPVFVHAGEIAKHGEGVEIGPSDVFMVVDSVVSLKPLDDCNVCRRDFLEPPLSGGSECFRGVADRKLNTIRFLHGTRGVEDRELVGQTVKSRHEIVNRVPQNDGASIEKPLKVGNVIDIENIIAGLRLELEPEAWSISFNRETLVDVLLQSVSVLFCPLYLEPDAI